jgi:SAM-dependent methyltransferase
MPLNDGERQVTPTPDAIRRDHVARYEWAAERLKGKKVIDVACGIGYGSVMLADAGCTVEAIDKDAETIEYAKKHYARERIAYRCSDATSIIGGDQVDAAVSFETIEHCADPVPMLLHLRDRAPLLLASVPNEECFPHSPAVEFHHRHYTRGQFKALLKRCGWNPLEWWGQLDTESELEQEMSGRTLVVVAERCEMEATKLVIAPFEIDWPVPEHVTILGLGPSLEQYIDHVKRLGGKHAYCDEVWGINAVGGVIMCDRVFHMDDVRIQEARAKALPESNIARMLEWLKVHPGPVLTSRPHPDYPGLVPFPLQAVLAKFEYDYFNSTAAYAVAYAVYLGVKRISLFGIDFTYSSSHKAETGKACVEFWLGIGAARGIKYTIAKSSSLMDSCNMRAQRLYGYDTVDVAISYDAQRRTRVEFTEREKYPTAEEMEERYDHSKHPSPLMQASER